MDVWTHQLSCWLYPPPPGPPLWWDEYPGDWFRSALFWYDCIEIYLLWVRVCTAGEWVYELGSRWKFKSEKYRQGNNSLEVDSLKWYSGNKIGRPDLYPIHAMTNQHSNYITACYLKYSVSNSNTVYWNIFAPHSYGTFSCCNPHSIITMYLKQSMFKTFKYLVALCQCCISLGSLFYVKNPFLV